MFFVSFPLFRCEALGEILLQFEGGDDVKARFLNVAKSFDQSEARGSHWLLNVFFFFFLGGGARGKSALCQGRFHMMCSFVQNVCCVVWCFLFLVFETNKTTCLGVSKVDAS